MNLRSKRLGSPLDPAASRLLESTREDAALLRDDIVGTLAHVAGLERARVLGRDEVERVRAALVQLHSQADSLVLRPDLEDVHMNVEAWLTERVGELGKKVHTGRSRNDQVALDLRLWARRACLELADAVHGLAQSLLALAGDHAEAVLPGHTHFQIAQPVLLPHWAGAHVARLGRDLERLEETFSRTNVCPLGAAAIAGTRVPVQPQFVADLLGFARPFDNSIDATSDRDFVHELLFDQAMVLNHVSALCEELIAFTHPAFGFFGLDDAHATGSSLMPQKKNPDVLEVARAKAATLIGALAASLATSKGLPLAYNRDYQEQKRLLLDTLPSGTRTVEVVADLVGNLAVHAEAMERMAGLGHSDATDLADYLVDKGVPFRDAHGQAARCVQLALEEGVALSKLSLRRLRSVNAMIGPDVFERIGTRASVRAKTSPGGTAPASASKALLGLRKGLAERASFLSKQRQVLDRVRNQLLSPTVVKSK